MIQRRGIARLIRIARRVTNAFVPRAIILLYHRVAELPLDPQLLCVSRKNFAEHLEVLRNWAPAVQVEALGQVLKSGSRGKDAVAITFDDGYADNLYNAKPLLERYDTPATVFVTSGYVGSNREFWYDALGRILLQTGPLPETLRLTIKGQVYDWQIDAVAENADVNLCWSGWNLSLNANPTSRHRVYRLLCNVLQSLRDQERQEILGRLAAWGGKEITSRQTHRTLSHQELIRLADGNLVEIGAHTVSHPVLSALPLNAQADEISRSKADLEDILGQRVTSFAYPFGEQSHYTQQTVAAVRQAGFKWACSNFPGIIRRGTDPWQLPRFLVRDWDGEEFARNLRHWTNA
jgi:peptidoglycan/xylan/chitin deacetylase (PgdA/CDA1 family)